MVGAGPAGNNTAYLLADLGYSVTVVDWRTQIGDKLCTGIVGRDCIRRFPLDESLVFRSVRTAKVTAPGGRTVEFSRPDVQAYVIDRVSYVSSFAVRAQRAGAEYLLGQRVTEIQVCEKGTKVRVTDEQESYTLTSKAVVLASGFGSDLAGQLGISKPGDYATAVQAEVMCATTDEIQVYFGRGVAPGFFAWLVPTSEGRALVGLISRHQGVSHLQSLMSRLQADGTITEVIKPAARWGIPLQPPNRSFGDRLLAVGDVAGQVKPTTGGGIYYALLASEIAADTLHHALQKDDLSAPQLSQYERRWREVLSHEIDIGYSARRLFETLDDCKIDSLMHIIASNGIFTELVSSRTLSFDWHGGIITKVIGHPLAAKALSLINPLISTLASQK